MHTSWLGAAAPPHPAGRARTVVRAVQLHVRERIAREKHRVDLPEARRKGQSTAVRGGVRSRE
eukprot:SAG31_NODE_3612_length_4067_cov_13.889617_7_plen_62_part_01